MKKNWPMRIASILLCLVLFTTYLMFGLYARYTTKGESTGSARVIKFGDIIIKENGDFTNGKATIIPGVGLEKDVDISFTGSEAATIVFIELELEGNWTKSDNRYSLIVRNEEFLSFSIDYTDQNVSNDIALSKKWRYLEDSNYVYYCTLKPNETITDMNVIVNEIIDGDRIGITVSNKIKRSDLDDLKDISINVKATVIQSNGFESVDDAWASIEVKGE